MYRESRPEKNLSDLALDGGFTRGARGALLFHELKGLRQDDVARVAASSGSPRSCSRQGATR